MSESKAEGRAPAVPQKQCAREDCENWFTPPVGGKGSGRGGAGGTHQKYCSNDCGWRARRKAQWVPPQPTECPGCGSTFTPRRGPGGRGRGKGSAGGKPQIYCTQKCGNKAREKVRQARTRAMSGGPIEIECGGCGGKFAPLNKRQKYHGIECLNAHRAGRRIDPPEDWTPQGVGKKYIRDATVRQCFWCGDVLPVGRRAVCPKAECRSVRLSLNAAKSSFGISREQYLVLWREQGGKCAICRNPPGPKSNRLAVDHDHNCCPDIGRSCGNCIRGLLCIPCNGAIGLLRDDPKVIRRAADYVARTRQSRLILAVA